jgi:hypothetical protein
MPILFVFNNHAIASLLEQAIYPVSDNKLLAPLPVSSLSLDKSYALNLFVGDVVRLGDFVAFGGILLLATSARLGRGALSPHCWDNHHFGRNNLVRGMVLGGKLIDKCPLFETGLAIYVHQPLHSHGLKISWIRLFSQSFKMAEPPSTMPEKIQRLLLITRA